MENKVILALNHLRNLNRGIKLSQIYGNAINTIEQALISYETKIQELDLQSNIINEQNKMWEEMVNNFEQCLKEISQNMFGECIYCNATYEFKVCLNVEKNKKTIGVLNEYGKR